MLPFLKPKQIAGLIISQRKPDGDKALDENENQSGIALEAAAERLIQAFNTKDSKSVAAALREAYAILEAEDSDESVSIE